MGRDNYQLQVQQAKERFLTYNQQHLIGKFGLDHDEDFLYLRMLNRPYRIHRRTGDTERMKGQNWRDGNSHGEVMTLLDLLCDSRDDRWLTGQWKSMQSFGMQFHQNLLEEPRDSVAQYFDRNPQQLQRVCRALGGEEISGGDYGFAAELFDGLKIGVLFWAGDEEFTPRLRYLWDENANMYIRYETMYYAVGLLKRRMMEL